jgi:hypothetical protein
VQDLPEVVRDRKSKLPSELSERVTFMAHDFLTEQPVKNADAYFFRWIFHNWSDEYCKKILRNLIPALKKDARVVVNDNCLPEPGYWASGRRRNSGKITVIHTITASPCIYHVFIALADHSSSSMDLTMLEIQNSYERDLDEWAALFERAD